MKYIRTTWIDRQVQYPKRYRDEANVQKTFTDDPGNITAAGTTVNAARLNNMEDGITYNNNAANLSLYQSIGGAL